MLLPEKEKKKGSHQGFVGFVHFPHVFDWQTTYSQFIFLSIREQHIHIRCRERGRKSQPQDVRQQNYDPKHLTIELNTIRKIIM